MDTERRTRHPIAPGRLTAALHMPKHGDPRLCAGHTGERLADKMADSAIGLTARCVLALHELAGIVAHRLGHHDNGEVADPIPHLVYMRGDHRHVVWDFWHQDHVRAPGDA